MDKNLLFQLAGNIGINLTPAELAHFEIYARELAAWNEKVNLTAIEDEKGIIIKHFYDSILGMKITGWTGAGKLLDLGTGAGFPGLPLFIANRRLQITLADSLQKRIAFLEHLLAALGLTGVVTIHARAEEIGRTKEHREAYDLVVSRAVARMPLLLEYCLPLLKRGGRFIAYKGPEAEEELGEAGRALNLLGAETEEIQRFVLPEVGGARNLVVIKKTRATPSEYPRRAGIPAKKPLR